MSAEIIEVDNLAIQPFKYEISQNSKGYVQLKITIRTLTPVLTDEERTALQQQFAEAFKIMKAEIETAGLTIQPIIPPKESKQ